MSNIELDPFLIAVADPADAPPQGFTRLIGSGDFFMSRRIPGSGDKKFLDPRGITFVTSTLSANTSATASVLPMTLPIGSYGVLSHIVHLTSAPGGATTFRVEKTYFAAPDFDFLYSSSFRYANLFNGEFSDAYFNYQAFRAVSDGNRVAANLSISISEGRMVTVFHEMTFSNRTGVDITVNVYASGATPMFAVGSTAVLAYRT